MFKNKQSSEALVSFSATILTPLESPFWKQIGAYWLASMVLLRFDEGG